jgi:hypothetical protein
LRLRPDRRRVSRDGIWKAFGVAPVVDQEAGQEPETWLGHPALRDAADHHIAQDRGTGPRAADQPPAGLYGLQFLFEECACDFDGMGRDLR